MNVLKGKELRAYRLKQASKPRKYKTERQSLPPFIAQMLKESEDLIAAQERGFQLLTQSLRDALLRAETQILTDSKPELLAIYRSLADNVRRILAQSER